jgi:hypothetical protein
MFKRAFENVLDKEPSKPELYPYLYSLSFKGLKKEVKKIVDIKPIKCSQCGAILTDISSIQEDEKIGTYYKCKYCGTLNVIEKIELSESYPNEVDFIIEDVSPKKEEALTKGTIAERSQGELYISVIDISGSMSGAKIEVVKKSLIQTLKDFKVNSPKTKFILVAFESSVYYYLRYDKEPILFDGDVLFSIEQMKAMLKKKVEKESLLGSIGEFADGWVSKISELRSMDMTALGPALFLAVASFDLFDLHSSGRITLLTDGLANQGIGNLSGTSIGAEDFYNRMADLCNQKNIIVDVVGVSTRGDKNEMGLQILGKLTDHTGGKLYLISSDEMEAIFTELRQMNYIGKDVKVKVITPSPIKLKKVTGAFSSEDIKESEINIGAVTEDRELFVELEAKPKDISEKKMESIPVQFQVEYKDNEGRRKLRVFDDRVKITDNENKFKATYDQRLNAIFNIQSSGIHDYSGKREKSKSQLLKLKQFLVEEMNTMKAEKVNFEENNFIESVDFLEDELEEMNLEEERAKEAPQASYFASVGQARTRISQDQVFNRLQKKGKYKKNK